MSQPVEPADSGEIQHPRQHFQSNLAFQADDSEYAVVGEGPAGLSCVLALLDQIKEQKDALGTSSISKITWYKARQDRVRRHIVTVGDRTTSIRALETECQLPASVRREQKSVI